MAEIDKKELSEADICDGYITPAIYEAGWKPIIQVRREVTLTPGPVVVRGNMSSRNKKRAKRADYVLQWEPDVPIAVVEAKDNKKSISHGMQQALGYADLLNVPSAFSSNGDGFASHNKAAVDGEDIETEFSLDNFPTPVALWARYKRYRGISSDEEPLIIEPYFDDGTAKAPRYYQVQAINKVVEEVAKGRQRLLLVMATGTGKTYTTFQIIWRLWRARHVKRILFLVDRNALADQTVVNDFKPFGSVMTKVKNRKIDPAYEVHIALYQALTGPHEEDKAFKSVSKDFFDLVVIDECHRGSAAEDSSWREVLEYFNSAIHLGLTATPKETEYISNIHYFHEPVYTYTLKQGIEDGYLAPYKVVRIDIDKDVLGWTPPPGMTDDLGQEIERREYNQADMDKILVLNQRTKLVAKRVMELLMATDPYSKTIIFCESVDHAERMRKAITNAARSLSIENSEYVVRITGDSPEGKAALDRFIDPEEKYPVIATTSDLLTTGVDAKTCKLIVLDKTIKSMTTFKQTIGRGTRIDEQHNKFFFTILDFKKATELFRDPEFDGEPAIIYTPGDGDDPVPPDPDLPDDFVPDDDQPPEGTRTITVSGVPAKIIGERIEYLGSDGQLVTESYRDFTRKAIREEFSSLDDFLRKWSESERKQAIIDELEKHGLSFEALAHEVGKEFGAFDLICHIAFDQPALTRFERVNKVKKKDYFSKYNTKAREVITTLLEKYATDGIQTLEATNVLSLPPLDRFGTPVEIVNDVFGGIEQYKTAINEIELALFTRDESA